MDMRHAEPEIVTIYRNTQRAEPPRVCTTCDHYSAQGVCAEFQDEHDLVWAAVIMEGSIVCYNHQYTIIMKKRKD